MDPIRYGFMRTIIGFVENFVNQLPPLLQLLLGIFLTIGIMKLLIMIADFFDKKREQNKWLEYRNEVVKYFYLANFISLQFMD